MPKNSEFFTGEELLTRWKITPYELRKWVENNNIECLRPNGTKVPKNGLQIIWPQGGKRVGAIMRGDYQEVDFFDPKNIETILIKKDDVCKTENVNTEYTLTPARQRKIAAYFCKEKKMSVRETSRLLFPYENPGAVEQQAKNDRKQGGEVYREWVGLYE